MHRPFKAQLILHGLAVLLFTMAFNAMASDQYLTAVSTGENQKQWVCDYARAHDNVLYLRCEDLASLYNDPLIMEGDYEENSTKLIPIWRRPSSNEGAVALVKAVICDQKTECSVQMKSLSDARRIVQR
ncbi:hypothetical protein [Candidatus Thiodiazotropha sp. CDECU1]|uniref:hypothetical protein n=1 Tax=Candidatus Thiodiazotropha sp. CDECU1 TaxID=3065865 RepID=UPI00292E18C3|nr:hypothetical protein [Candidatus Thiodiazotropha sp. CDECU1]